MKYIEPLGIPEIQFAHICGADCYEATLPARPSTLEVTYINRGSLCLEQSGTACEARENDIICNFYQSDLHVYSSGFHRHHTVCFHVSFGEARDSGVPGPAASTICHFCSAPRIPAARGNSSTALSRKIRSGRRTVCPARACFWRCWKRSTMRSTRPNPGAGNPFMWQKAKKYIFTNLGFPIHQRDIANHLGISPQYLMRHLQKGRKACRS